MFKISLIIWFPSLQQRKGLGGGGCDKHWGAEGRAPSQADWCEATEMGADSPQSPWRAVLVITAESMTEVLTNEPE